MRPDTSTLFLAHFDQRSRKDVVTGRNAGTDTTGTLAGSAATPAKFGAGALGNPSPRNGAGGVVAHWDALGWTFGTGAFTVDFWVRLTSFADVNVLFATGDLGSNHTGFVIQTAASTGQVQIVTTIAGATVLTSTINLSLNTYHHIALTRSSTTFTLYIDGTERGTGTDATIGANFNTGMLYVGSRPNGGQQTRGVFDEFRVSSVVRYTGAFTPPSAAYDAPLGAVDDPALDTQTKFLDHFRFQQADEAGNDLLSHDATILAGGGPFVGSNALVPNTFGARYESGPQLNIGSSDLTIEARVFFTSLGSGSRLILSHYDATGGVVDYWLLAYYLPGTYWYFGHQNAPGEVFNFVHTPTLNTWYAIAVTRSGSTWRMFLDGVLVKTATNSNAVPYTASLRTAVGGSSNGTGLPIIGRVAEPRITIGLARYTASYTPALAPFTS